MQKVTKWRWRLRSETMPWKTITSTIPLTEEEALGRDPDAVKVPGSDQVFEEREPGDPVQFNTRPVRR